MNSKQAIASGDRAIELFLQNRVAEILGVALSAVSSHSALSRLGLDSLGMLHLVESIESDLQREIPATVCFDRLTIESLASVLAGVRPSGATAHSHNFFDQMLADSRLPDDIRPEAAVTLSGSPCSILLTGATGFLGGFLLRSLLRDTKARIVCLARANQRSARTRIQDNLERYGIWEERYKERIQIFEADLSQPRLGLSPVCFDALAAGTDVVFHAAASVNWVQSYARLRNSNVLAVRELLRLACRHKAKPFHFVSTLAVCYSTAGPPEIRERDDAFRDLSGIHLSYAQSKCVAESLARTAAQRGLPVSIFRPSLISGDSISGVSNTGDFFSTFVKGCVAMGAAPDLDWCLDLLPVDYAADVIAHLALSPTMEPFRVVHLANPKVRHWRELILWMNLFGYRLELLPYEEWLIHLEADGSRIDHPLRDLAPFFRKQPEGQQGRYLPELYEETRRRKVHFGETRAILDAHGLNCPELSAALLDRYFSSLIDRQFLPAVARSSSTYLPSSEFDVNFFRSVTGDSRIVRAARAEFAGGHSIIGELTSWKHGQSIGLHGYRLDLASENGGETRFLDVVVKSKPTDSKILEVGEAIATLCSPELGRAYRRYSDRLGLSGCDVRELALYEHGGCRFRRYTPAFYGGRGGERLTVLILERLSGLELMDSVDYLDAWTPAHIEAAIEGMSEIHAIWYGEHSRLCDQPWLKTFPTRTGMMESKELWMALAEHARPIFSRWAGPELGLIQRRLIESLDDCWCLIETMPHTLIHNDFNPRNLAFRHTGGKRRLCLYDWELATRGLPQHDLAELLCFVLGPELQKANVLRYVEMQRLALESATGQSLEERSWLRGFRLSLYDLMVNRLPAYAMIHRFRSQPFLERVIRTWKALVSVLPLDLI